MKSKAVNNTAIILATLTALLFFISNGFNILNYTLIKYLIILMVLGFGFTVGFFLFMSSLKKNHPEDEPQDDNN
jgi:hypothetical protein